MTNRRHYITLAAILTMFGFIVGCAGGYGNMRVEDKGGMTVETLVSNFQNYNVYYAGIDAGSPFAVLFDPKDDGKTIKVASRWERVTSQATASQMVGMIGSRPGVGVNIPRLWKLLGPNDSVFGYVYTFATQLNLDVADPNTMFVDY